MKDNRLDIREFDNMCQQINIPLPEDEAKDAFSKFDYNRSGCISLEEFTHFVTTY